MPASLRQFVVAVVAIGMIAVHVPSGFADDEKSPAADSVSYYRQIRPIFQARCQGCHQPAKPSGGYVMTSFDLLLKGGESETAAVVPGKPAESYLIHEITVTDGQAEMPKNDKPLAESEIELITKWITQGAKDDTPASARTRYDAKNPPLYSAPPVITALDYSPDGTLLAVAGFHEVLLHKADGSGLVARLVGMSDRIESVRFSPDGSHLVVAGGKPARMGEIQVWNVAEKKLTLSHAITYDTVYGANWSPDGKLVSFGCSDNTIRAIDVTTGKQVLYQGAHNDWVRDTVFSLKGDHVISVGRDRSTKLTELATQRFVDNVTSITPGALKGGIASIDRHPTADAILVGGADGVPRIYRIFRESKRVIGDDANLIKRLPGLPGRLMSVAFSPDGKRVVAGSSLNGRGEVGIYEVTFDVKLPDNLKKIVQKVSTTRNQQERDTLEKSRTENVKLLASAKFDTTGIFAVSYSSDGKTIATAGRDGRVRLLNADNASIVKEFVPVPIATAEQLAKANKSAEEIVAANSDAQQEQPKLELPAGAKLIALEVEPKSVKLRKPFDVTQIIVTGRLESGDVVDLTRSAKRDLSAEVVTLTAGGLMRPNLNGQARLTLSVNDLKTEVPIDVAGIVSHPDVSFVRDVAPTISKLGCNQGTCHGSKDGKNGFKLSLRGYDPLYDVRAFTDDLASRRVSIAAPEQSLMLLKATGSVPHAGSQLTREGEPYYEIIRNWISTGAQLDLDAPRVVGIEISPENPVVQKIGTQQQVRIVATYADGTQRDVTSETFVESGNTDIVTVDSTGLVDTLRRGEAPILARYEGSYAATTVTVMGDRSGFEWAEPPTNNYIDELIAQKLKRMKTLPSDLCTDAEFIRRIYLDITGLPPSADTVRAFLADKRETRVKREEVIDKLIGSEEYVEHWANKWADLLQVNRKFLGAEGAKSFRGWIRKEVAANTPYDEFALKILTATGSNRENPASSYYKILRTPQDTMENTTHLFLAVRFNCNKCHDHPFERWTQDQYYQTAAFFAQFGLKKDPESKNRRIGGTAVEGAKPLYEVVFDQTAGEIKHDRTGEITAPDFPYLASHTAKKDASRRERLANWITSKDNQYFAKSYTNRIWGYLTGVGLIEPLDDIRAGNPPTNPELLDRLTNQFIDSGFNVRDLIATICKSRTYQLSIDTNKWNDDDRINYSHAMARRLPAEVLYDAIHAVTGSVSKIPGVPNGTRAAALPDSGVKLPSGFLQNLGRPARESSCECERATGLQLGPVMALVSGPTLSGAVSDGGNELAKIVSSKMTDAELINELFMRILNRPATAEEVAASEELMKAVPVDHQALMKELADYKVELAPITKQKEADRLALIEKTKADIKAYEAEIAPRRAEMEKARQDNIAKKQAELDGYNAKLPAKLTKWEKEKGTSQTVWYTLNPHELKSTFGQTLTKENDLSIFASEKKGAGSYIIKARTDLIGITAIRLELLTDKRLKKNGPGRAPDGNFVLTEFEVSAAPSNNEKAVTKLKLQNAKADFSQANFEVAKAIDGNVKNDNGWATSPRFGQNRTATFELAQPVGDRAGTVFTFDLKQMFLSQEHYLGRFRISVTTSPNPATLNGLPTNLANLLAISPAKRNKKQVDNLLSYYRTIDGDYKKFAAALAASKKPLPPDPQLVKKQAYLKYVEQPLPPDRKLVNLERAVDLSTKQVANPRLVATQDLAWALINSPAFLFNR